MGFQKYTNSFAGSGGSGAAYQSFAFLLPYLRPKSFVVFATVVQTQAPTGVIIVNGVLTGLPAAWSITKPSTGAYWYCTAVFKSSGTPEFSAVVASTTTPYTDDNTVAEIIKDTFPFNSTLQNLFPLEGRTTGFTQKNPQRIKLFTNIFNRLLLGYFQESSLKVNGKRVDFMASGSAPEGDSAFDRQYTATEIEISGTLAVSSIPLLRIIAPGLNYKFLDASALGDPISDFVMEGLVGNKDSELRVAMILIVKNANETWQTALNNISIVVIPNVAPSADSTEIKYDGKSQLVLPITFKAYNSNQISTLLDSVVGTYLFKQSILAGRPVFFFKCPQEFVNLVDPVYPQDVVGDLFSNQKADLTIDKLTPTPPPVEDSEIFIEKIEKIRTKNS